MSDPNLEDYRREFGDEDIEKPASRSPTPATAGGAKHLELWVTRADGPADLPTRESLRPELLVATPGSLRLLVPSRGEYELLYGAVGVLAVFAFVAFWFTGVVPLPNPLGRLSATDPQTYALVLLATAVVGASSAGILGLLYWYRVGHHPEASVALTASELIPKRDRVFIKVSDGRDTFWLSAARPNGYKQVKNWEGHVRETLSLAGQPLEPSW